MVEQGSDHEVITLVEAAAKAVRGIEPVQGKVEAAQLSKVRSALDALMACHARRGGLDGLSADEVAEIEVTIVGIHARAAAIAIALGEGGHADRWLAEAERLARDDEQRAELSAGRRAPERFRALV